MWNWFLPYKFSPQFSILFLKIYFNAIPLQQLDLPSGLFLLHFSIKIPYALIFCLLHAVCHAIRVLLLLLWYFVFDELWSFPLCILLHPPLYFLRHSSKYSSQDVVLEPSQYLFFRLFERPRFAPMRNNKERIISYISILAFSDSRRGWKIWVHYNVLNSGNVEVS